MRNDRLGTTFKTVQALALAAGVLLSLTGTCQATTWVQRLMGLSGFNGLDGALVANRDGTLVVLGRGAWPADAGQQTSPVIARIGGDGSIQWVKRFSAVPGAAGGTESADAAGDGGVIAAGLWEGGREGNLAVLARIDASGSLAWLHKVTPGPQKLLVDGDALFLARTGQNRVEISKLDLPSMAFLWSKAFTYQEPISLAGLRRDADGGLLVAFEFYAREFPDSMVLKVSPAGDTVFAKRLGIDRKGVFIKDVLPLGDGYALVGGTTQGAGDSDAWVAKVGADWRFRWQKALGGCAGDEAYRVVKMGDGSLLVGAWIASGANVPGTGDLWGINVKPADTWGVNWQKRYWTPDGEYPVGLAAASDGGLVMFGPHHAGDQLFLGSLLLKADASGAVAAAGCDGLRPCPAVSETSATISDTTVVATDHPPSVSALVPPTLTATTIILEDGSLSAYKICGE